MKKYLTLKNLGWLVTAIVTFMLGSSGVSKVMATQEMVQNFEFMKLTPYLSTTGLLELAGVILLIIPRTSIYGAILISCMMSGAVALHLSLMGGVKVMVPILIGLLTWTSYCLRKYDVCFKK